MTSDKCYENREWVWGYRENDPMGGHDPYSASKGCAEILFSAWYRSYFSPEQHGKSHQVAAASVRAGNVIGGGDWGKDRLVPDCFRALAKDEAVVIRSPSAIRPWQHVLERSPLSRSRCTPHEGSGRLSAAAGTSARSAGMTGTWRRSSRRFASSGAAVSSASTEAGTLTKRTG